MKTAWRVACALVVSGALTGPVNSQGPAFERPAGAAAYDEPLIAAGFRALFTCSAHFIAGRSLDDIVRVELADTKAGRLPLPEIDAERRIVTQRFGASGARIAAWRDATGCTILPPNLGRGDIAHLPYATLPSTPNVAAQPFPIGAKTSLPADGLDPRYTALAMPLQRAFDAETYGASTLTAAVLVLHDNDLVVERYADGFDADSGYRTWSTAKSISAILIGIAVDEGLLSLDAPVNIAEWQYGSDPRAEITLRDLLQMSSGLYSQGSNTNAIYFGGQDAVSAATTTVLESRPGERWKYANNDTLLALIALRQALRDDTAYLRFPYERLLYPLGMIHTRMEIDHRGNFIGSSQVYTTARDLARFGLMLLGNGRFNDRQVVSRDWLDFVRSPAPAKPAADGQWGYGGQFWLLDGVEGLPADTYTTAGNKGQFVTVVPSRRLVVVRTGVNPDGVRFDQARFVADMLAALPD